MRTDAVGTFAYNEHLSRARAEAVKEFLVKEMNVVPERLTAVGRAFCEPADPKKGVVKGSLKIADANAFWGGSKYLILVEQ